MVNYREREKGAKYFPSLNGSCFSQAQLLFTVRKKKYPVLSNFWNFHRQPWKGTQKRHPKEMLQDSSGELFPYSLTLCYQKEERGWTWSLLKYKLSSCWSSYSKSRVGGRKEQLWQHSFVIFLLLLRLLLAGWLVFSGCAGLWHHCKLLGSQGPSVANFWPRKLCLFYSYPVILSFLYQESKPRCRQRALCIEWICKGVTRGLTNPIATHLEAESLGVVLCLQ